MKECQNYWETIEKNWLSQNFDFLSLKGLSLGHFLETCNSCRYHWILIFLVVTYKLEVWEQICAWIFYCFNFERNYDVLKSKTSSILLNKNTNFNKNKTESNKENPTHNFREAKSFLQLIWSSWKKKRAFFYRLFWPKRLFKIFVLSQCIVYWILFQNRHTFTHQINITL